MPGLTQAPRLTVITVAWNAARTIADTMRSMAAQKFTDYEHIIVDGSSTDDTLAIVEKLRTERTRVVSEPDRGLYDAMNKGLAMARGAYIGFLNSDDFLVRSDALGLLAAATNNRPPAISAGVVIVRKDRPSQWVRSYSSTHFAPWMLRFGHMPPHPGFYTRADIALSLGPFDSTLRISADFDWILRFHQRGLTASSIPETLVAVREGGKSNRGLASRRLIARETLRSLRNHGQWSAAPLVWGKYIVKSIQYISAPTQFPAPVSVRWVPDSP